MATEIGFFDVLKMIVFLGIILFGAYYLTKLLASKAAGTGGKNFFSMGSGAMGDAKVPTIIHRMVIDRESSFVVVEYNNSDYLIAFTNGAIKVVEKRKLSESEIEFRVSRQHEKEQNSFNFSKYMEKFKDSQSDKGVDKD